MFNRSETLLYHLEHIHNGKIKKFQKKRSEYKILSHGEQLNSKLYDLMTLNKKKHQRQT